MLVEWVTDSAFEPDDLHSLDSEISASIRNKHDSSNDSQKNHIHHSQTEAHEFLLSISFARRQRRRIIDNLEVIHAD